MMISTFPPSDHPLPFPTWIPSLECDQKHVLARQNIGTGPWQSWYLWTPNLIQITGTLHVCWNPQIITLWESSTWKQRPIPSAVEESVLGHREDIYWHPILSPWSSIRRRHSLLGHRWTESLLILNEFFVDNIGLPPFHWLIRRLGHGTVINHLGCALL